MRLLALCAAFVVVPLRAGPTSPPPHHVHLAHLQQGSVRVAIGDRATFEGSDGLPFVVTALDVLGETSVDRALGETAGGPAPRLTPVRRTHVLPLHGAVVRVGPVPR